MIQVQLVPAAAGQRLDAAVAEATQMSRSQVQKRFKDGLIEIDGVVQREGKHVARGDERVIIQEADAQTQPPAPELTVLYEDEDVIAIDKPAGLVVHASESGRVQPTVAAFARARGVEDEDQSRPGIIHRLDKDTSGVMLIAKNPDAKRWLQQAFKQRRVKKRYLALVEGRLAQDEAHIRLPIGRDRRAPIKRAVVPGARPAITNYKVERGVLGATLVNVDLETGRTHQIRVHFSHLGHPVVGDTLYGHPTLPAGLTRQFLHAASLTFELPSGAPVTIESPLPPELVDYLAHLEGTV